MTDSDFNSLFGTQTGAPSFTQRVGKAAPAAAGETATGTGAYRPYGFLPTGTVNETCEVSHWIDGTLITQGIEFQYRFLMQVGYVGEEQLKLFLPDCIVVIEGAHLHDLRKKLCRRQVTFVTEYSAKVWPQRPAKGEPIIERVSVVRPDKAS